MTLALFYLIGAGITWLLATTEIFCGMYMPGFNGLILASMLGGFAAAAWPLVGSLFIVFVLSQGRLYEPNSGLMCRLTGGHDWWKGPGGIPFRGEPAIWTNGWQKQSCHRCRAERWVWPWGNEKFSKDETFGYARRTR